MSERTDEEVREYIPYGDEWKKMMMLHKKEWILDRFVQALRQKELQTARKCLQLIKGWSEIPGTKEKGKAQRDMANLLYNSIRTHFGIKESSDEQG